MTFYENRCLKCNSFVCSAPGYHSQGGHSGYCKTFSFINGKWIGSVISKKHVQSRCPYNLVIKEEKER